MSKQETVVPSVIEKGESFVVRVGKTDVGRDYEVYRFEPAPVAGNSPSFTFLAGQLRKTEALVKAAKLNEKR